MRVVVLLVVVVVAIALSDQQLMYRVANDQRTVYVVNRSGVSPLLSFANITSTSARSAADEQQAVQVLDKKSTILNNNNNNNGVTGADFQLLYHNERYMLVGTRNRLLNMSLLGDIYDRHYLDTSVVWQTSPKTDSYVRAAIPLNYATDQVPLLVVCASTAHSAQQQAACRTYNNNNNGTAQQLVHAMRFVSPAMSPHRHVSLQLSLPPFAHQNAVYFFHSASTHSHALVQQQDIHKQTLLHHQQPSGSSVDSLLKFGDLVRTPPGAIKNANFRSSFAHKDKLYFTLTESDALDFTTRVSLIAEICQADRGRAPSSFTSDASTRRFLTFKKTLISCYMPDASEMIHVKYNEIQQASEPVATMPGDESSVFYGIFTLRRANNMIDSALCSYELAGVESLMRNGLFKSNPLRTRPMKPLAACDHQMSAPELDAYYKDVTKYGKFQLEEALEARAMFALSNVKFTAIAVDVVDAGRRHVLFVGTSTGRVIKLVMMTTVAANHNGQQQQQAVIVGDYQVFDTRSAVNNLFVTSSSLGSMKRLVAVSTEQVKSIRLDVSCARHATCVECVGSLDPHCAWSSTHARCVFKQDTEVSSSSPFSSTCGNALKNNGSFVTTTTSEDAGWIDDSPLPNVDSYRWQDEDADGDEIEQQQLPLMISTSSETTRSGSLFVAIMLTAVLTSLASTSLTCYVMMSRATAAAANKISSASASATAAADDSHNNTTSSSSECNMYTKTATSSPTASSSTMRSATAPLRHASSAVSDSVLKLGRRCAHLLLSAMASATAAIGAGNRSESTRRKVPTTDHRHAAQCDEDDETRNSKRRLMKPVCERVVLVASRESCDGVGINKHHQHHQRLRPVSVECHERNERCVVVEENEETRTLSSSSSPATTATSSMVGSGDDSTVLSSGSYSSSSLPRQQATTATAAAATVGTSDTTFANTTTASMSTRFLLIKSSKLNEKHVRLELS